MKNCRILIVEDDPISATLLCELCKSCGFKACHIANNSYEALHCISKYNVDLILLDIDLEKEHAGIDLAITAKQERIPVVFVTGKTDEESIRLATQVDAYAYLVKPINPAEFKANVKITLYKSEQMHLREKDKKKMLSLFNSCIESEKDT